MNKIHPILLSLLILTASAPGLAEDTFKPFVLRLRVCTLEFVLPSDFEVIDYRTGGGGPFYGRRSEIEEFEGSGRGTTRTPKLVKGVLQVNDVVRDLPIPVFDRSTKRFVFETASEPKHDFPIETIIESMKRADTPSVPILLVKAKIVSKADQSRRGPRWVYSAHLALPDDSYLSILFHTLQPPTKTNDDIWERFATSIRERQVTERPAR